MSSEKNDQNKKRNISFGFQKPQKDESGYIEPEDIAEESEKLDIDYVFQSPEDQEDDGFIKINKDGSSPAEESPDSFYSKYTDDIDVPQKEEFGEAQLDDLLASYSADASSVEDADESAKPAYGEIDADDDNDDQQDPQQLKESIKERLEKMRRSVKKDRHDEHEHRHEHHHDHDGCAECGHDHADGSDPLFRFLFLASVVLFIVSFIKISAVGEVVYSLLLAAAAVFAALPVFIAAVKNVSKGNIDENVLMTISVIAACLLGEFREAAAVAIFFRLGEMMEEYASKRSKDSIRSLSEIQVDTANVISASNDVEKIKAEDVEIGSNIVIYPHERFPLDCVVISGSGYTDASAITGESIPVAVDAGDTVYSGTINGAAAICAKTIKTLEESTASRIIKMVEEASEKKSKTQKLISRIAAYYTPAVVILALIIALVPSLITKDWGEWIRRSLVLLVASCPCALVLSIPLGFFTSMGTAARNGILIKGSKYIEETAKASCAAFDKTGTLTTDELSVDEVVSPAGLDPQIILLLAAIAESRSNHPIAKAIKASAPEFDAGDAVTDEEEHPGLGTCVSFAGKRITCGSKKLLDSKGIYTAENDGIFVAVDNDVIGIIKVKAAVREDVEETIKELRESGISHIVMLTGDNEESAKQIAKEIDIDEYHAALMPEDKLSKVEELKQTFGKVIYVGDGINDAPVLAAADVGIGMGLGSHAANEAADVVLTNNNLSKLALAKKLAVKTMNVLKANIISIMAVKLIVIILGIFGIAPMWLAVFADVGLCVIAVIISATIAYDNINDIIRSIFKKK